MSKKLALRLAAIPALAAASIGTALAEVPTEVSGALTTAKTDGVSVATLVLLAVIAIFAFKFMRKGL